MIGATGIGSWPGTDVHEATVTVRDLLDDPDGLGLSYLPETPARGPGADILGRAAALLVDLHVDLQPSGWRLVDRPGRDAGRAAGFHREDLDEAAAAYDGYSGPLKVQVAGPWTLAAGIRLPRGERALTDPGAARDLTDSLAEGVQAYLAHVRELVPGADLVLQLDEPSVPAVLEGILPTQSGYGTVRAVDARDVEDGIGRVLAVHDGPVAIHCCHERAPVPVLREALMRQPRPAAVALDVTNATPARWESLAATLESGVALWAGYRLDGGPGSARSCAGAIRAGIERAGLDLAGLEATAGWAALMVTPPCGLAGLSPAAARQVQLACLDAARELSEVAAS